MDREEREKKAEKAGAELSVFFFLQVYSSESGLQHLSQISHFAEHIWKYYSLILLCVINIHKVIRPLSLNVIAGYMKSHCACGQSAIDH